MDEDTLADLKQFITGTISQQTAQLRDDIRSDLASVDSKLNGLVQDLSNLSEQVAEAIDSSNEATEAQLKNHETHITSLEQKAA